MKRISQIAQVSVLIGLSAGVWSCRGKEGPQGPPGPAGQNLTWPQQGYIEGEARGKDNDGTPFVIPFHYVYHYGLPGTWEPNPNDSNVVDISIQRHDGAGAGYFQISFSYDKQNRRVCTTSLCPLPYISATITDVSQRPTVPVYYLSYTPTRDSVQIQVQSFSEQGITGRIMYISPADTLNTNNRYADTVTANFSVELVRLRRYQRVAPR